MKSAMTPPAGSHESRIAKMRTLGGVSVCILLWVAVSALGDSTAPARKPLAAVRVADSRGFTGRQFLQVDRAGHVFLFREASCELFQISAGRGLIPKGRLQRKGAAAPEAPVAAAARGLTGAAWALFSFPNHIDLIDGDKAEHLESPWIVSDLVLNGGEPWVAVIPAEMATAAPDTLRLAAPPLLMSWDGKRWTTLVEGRFAAKRLKGVSRPEQLRGEFAVLLAATPERRIWAADEHAYRLRRFSPSGSLEDELVVGEGQVRWRERTAEEWDQAGAAAKEAGLSFDRRSLSATRPEEVVRALASGRDGSVFLLVQSEKGLSLDRFNPALVTLDRVPLTGVDASPDRLALAAGSGGLYLASREGVWTIDAEALDHADWQHVPEAVLNGQPLEPPKAK